MAFKCPSAIPNVMLVWRNHNRQAAIDPVPPNEHYLFWVAFLSCYVLDMSFWFDLLYGMFGALEDTRETRWRCEKEIPFPLGSRALHRLQTALLLTPPWIGR